MSDRHRGRAGPVLHRHPRTSLVATVIAAALSTAPLAAAQSRSVPLQGVTYDSLRGAPLAGARVTLAGTTQSTTTDARGRFQLDSVTPGHYTLIAQHAALDSIGLSGISAVADVADGRQEIRIAVPSFATLWRAMCGTERPPRDSGFVYGTIRDARAQNPLVGAAIDVTWLDLSMSGARSVQRTPWRARTVSDERGGFVACGVPLGVGLTVRAWSDSGSSGTIDLFAEGLRVQRRDLLVGFASDSGPESSGTITGVITDSAGHPVADARVRMEEVAEVRTSADGRFTLRQVPSGTRQVELLALGRMPIVVVVDVVAQDTARIAATMRKVTTLDVVRVRAPARVRLAVMELQERRRSGFGYVRDSSEIASHGTLSSVFYEFPGVQIERGSGSTFGLSMKAPGPGRCFPNLWIDGRQERDVELLNTLHPDEIAAVEVYPQAFSVPSRFMGRDSRCGAVIVWTKWSFG